MYIPEKMQVNKFRDVAIPENKSFYQRMGEVDPKGLSYSGDDVVPENQRAVESLSDYEQYAAEQARLAELEERNANK